jgi:peroxiredoxin Q/BCP
MREGLIAAGETAPDFTLPAADNTIWKLSQLLRGRRVLLIFYQRDCPACRTLLPFVERMHRRLQQADLRVAGVAQDSHPDTLELADAFQITFPLLLDHPRLAVTRGYGATEIPTQVWLSQDGKVLGTLVGFSRNQQDALFLRLARELGKPESSLFAEGDLIPESVPSRPWAARHQG